jgi:hypothetical protein
MSTESGAVSAGSQCPHGHSPPARAQQMEIVMKMNFHSDNGAPCWRCSGTIYTYTVDDCVTYVGARCIGCRADNMFYPPSHCGVDRASDVSAAHRESAENMAVEAEDKATRRTS